jgi:DNA-binding response OmpR family regulator/class 3 adenylate cyclase
VLILAESAALRATIARFVRAAGHPAELAGSPRRARQLVADGGVGLAIVAPGQFGPGGSELAAELHDGIGRVLLIAEREEEARCYARTIPAASVILAGQIDEQAVIEHVRQAMSGPSAVGKPIPAESRPLRFAGCTLDIDGRTFRDAGGREIALTRTEFSALLAFAGNPGRVLSREQIRRAVGGDELETYDRAVDMLISRLRRKVELDPRTPALVLTVPGSGYKFAGRVERIEEPAVDTVPITKAVRAPLARPGIAERRQLTVLACRIVGLTPLAAELDPEDLQSLLGALREQFIAIIESFGGFVASFLGGNLVGYFGYSEAHEDDAERAIRAGLTLIESTGDQVGGHAGKLQVRAAVATGSAVVGDLAAIANRELAAVGEAPTLAGQLVAGASAGTVLVTARTRELAGGAFFYRRAAAVGGGDGIAPVEAWQVIAAKPFLGRSANRTAGRSPVLPAGGARAKGGQP